MPFFFADTVFSQALINDVTFLIKDVIICTFSLIIEVCHIIINNFRGTTCFFNEVCVNPAYDPIFIIGDKGGGLRRMNSGAVCVIL